MAHEHTKESCKEVFALLSQYLDRELPEATCEEIREHLADCPPCIEFLESLKRTVALCQGYETSEQPAPIAEDEKKQLAAAYRKALQTRTA